MRAIKNEILRFSLAAVRFTLTALASIVCPYLTVTNDRGETIPRTL